LQILKIDFVFHRPDHRVAIPVFEKLLDHPPDPILLLDCVAVALLRMQGALKILSLANLVALEVYQPKTEVPNHPKERGEVFLNLLRIALSEDFRTNLEVLREIDNQAERIDGIFVYCAH
jgi:hypothetical protein